MAFPTSLTNAVDGVTDALAAQLNAVEAKIGADSSAVTTSHDYKLSGVTGTDKAVSKTGTETLTNKTLTTPVINGAVTGTMTVPLTAYSNLGLSEGQMINGKIVPSVASNNLTVALKGMDGNDPSATNPVYVRINSVVYAVTGALSVTKNAGTNWLNAGGAEFATKEMDFFVYLAYEGAVVIGFARISHAVTGNDFNGSSTLENAFLSSLAGNLTAGSEARVVGRFAATLSGGAGYTWSVPTFTATNLVQRPIYETRWLAWVPSGAGYTAGGAVYRFFNKTCHIIIDSTANITGNSSTPYAAANTVDNQLTTSVGTAYIAKNSSTITVASNPQNICGFYELL